MARRKPLYATIGAFSSRDPTEDPIGGLACELKSLLKRYSVKREVRKEHVALLKAIKNLRNAHCPSKPILSTLAEALQYYAPPYSTFCKKNEEFGFWPNINQVRDDLHVFPDSADIPSEFWGDDVAVINNHGNVYCGYLDRRGKWHEYWSCV